jgi:hypothetical protein
MTCGDDFLDSNKFNNEEMEKQLFDHSTHRLVQYKGKSVAIPLMVYWKLSDMQPDETVIIQDMGKNDGTIAALATGADISQYHKVKVSELSGINE